MRHTRRAVSRWGFTCLCGNQVLKGQRMIVAGTDEACGDCESRLEANAEALYERLSRERSGVGRPYARALSSAQIKSIREDRDSGMTLKRLAEKYKISVSTVTKYCSGL